MNEKSLAIRRFLRSRLVWFGLAVLAAVTVACAIGFVVASQQVESRPAGTDGRMVGKPSPRYDVQDLGQSLAGPSAAHWFGTDQLGRDVLIRTLYGGAISLVVGLLAALVSVIVGVAWGAAAGYLGGRIDGAMMRIVDVLYGLPYILLVILFTIIFGKSIYVLFLAIGSVSWLTMARVVRGQVLSLRTHDFVMAAVAAGAKPGRIILVHLLPNLLGPIIVYATLIIPQAILQESFLSFLGIGVQSPAASWGSLASDGITRMNPVVSFWWLIFFPCLALALTLLSLNLIGDGLRDAFDPQLRRNK